MKIESITKDELIAAYIRQNYGDKEVLVINWDGNLADGAFERLLESLSAYAPPVALQQYPSYIIIEMPAVLANKIVRTHYVPNMEVWLFGDMLMRN